jgi:hypothetical protein
MVKQLLFISAFFLAGWLYASPGDTTLVRAHDKVDMTWYQTYQSWGVFPAKGPTYHRINLHLTLGCASTGCSDWDYTVIVWMVTPQGNLEIAKMITPYGGYMRQGTGGFNNQWSHTLVYDVTDFQMYMHDSVSFLAQYQGWSSGFALTLDFEMIEGIPARNVHKITRVWSSNGGSYQNPNNFNNNLFGDTLIVPDATTVYSWLRLSPSGHGFINNQNCAEFCIRDYYVKVNNQTIATQRMWRDDCGLNPIYPQGGTWLYNRANWCPGGKVFSYDHNLTPYLQPGGFNLNFDIQNYTVTVPPGETPPTYFVGNVLFEADQIAHQNDVELMEILAPGVADDYKRLNPICGKVILKIRNKGAQPLSSATIRYRFNSGQWHQYNWTGNLNFFDEEIVHIENPLFGLWEIQAAGNTFEATVSQPNGVTDAYALNNTIITPFELIETFPRNFFLMLRTNNVGSDTWWTITRMDDQTVVSQGDNLASSTFFYDTLRLGAGCYELVIGDRSGNGLSFWANNDGAGMLRLMGHSGTTFVRTLPLDFGSEYRKYFLVSSDVGVVDYEPFDREILLFPNPTSDGRFEIQAPHLSRQTVQLEVTDVSGKALLSNSVRLSDQGQYALTLPLAPGSYFIRISQEGVLLKTHKLKVAGAR